MNVKCPECKKVIEVIEWIAEKCPNCGREYWWEESESNAVYSIIEWEK